MFTQTFIQAQIRSKKTSNLRATGLCEGNSPVTDEFPAQRASDAENVSIWWRHHGAKWIPNWWSVYNLLSKFKWIRHIVLSVWSQQAVDVQWYTSQQCLHYYCHTLQWRHNKHDDVSNYQPNECLLNHVCRRRSKKTSNLRVTGLCAGNSPVTGEFPAQRASDAENVSIWWRHHEIRYK